MNAGEMKLEGNAQWIVYVDAGPESRRASILSVSAKPRTPHFEALVKSAIVLIGASIFLRPTYKCMRRSPVYPKTLQRC